MQDQFNSLEIMRGHECPNLSSLTTFELGTKPKYYAKACSVDRAIAIAKWTSQENIPLWVVGGGSNLLCDDQHLEGLVLQIALEGLEWEADAKNEDVTVTLGAGVVWHDFVEESVKRGLAGVECLVGIPGWAGAAPIQNIGAYGQSLSDTCSEVYVYDLEEDQLAWWSASQCDFAYRQSHFKKHLGRYLILAIKLKLKIGAKPTLNYPQVIETITKNGYDLNTLDLEQVSTTIKSLRSQKSMFWQSTDPNRRSAGSFFMNPLISGKQVETLRQNCQSLGLDTPPLWPSEQSNTYKVPAAWLIEQSGIDKGFRYKNVGVSSKHCLALVSHDQGDFEDILDLAQHIQKRVWATFGISLLPEIRILSSELTHKLSQPRARVALVTCQNLPKWEVDDHPLWAALVAQDIELFTPAWDEPDFDWSSCDLVIPRTTWDYQDRWSEFLQWMRHVNRVSQLLNPLSLMEWNLDKRYLKELAIEQPPTHWLEQQTLTNQELQEHVESLIQVCQAKGWLQGFLKPTIAASAVGTLRFDLDQVQAKEQIKKHLQEWLPKRNMILQPYVKEVESLGECSLIYFKGEFSHAVRKVPVSGDYRVQDDYGASDMPWSAPLDWQKRCEYMLKQLKVMPLYARCDFLTNPQGEPWLIELELIEPSLFFRHNLESPTRFAQCIVDSCRERLLKSIET